MQVHSRNLNSTQALGQLISNSLADEGFESKETWPIAALYRTLLEDILHTERETRVPGTVDELKKHFAGQTIVEFGCRNGHFLKFLQKLGADVYGTTCSDYIKTAVNLVGTGRIKEATSQDAGVVLGKLNPRYILSHNLFAYGRWLGSDKRYQWIDLPLKNELEAVIYSMRLVCSAETRCLIHPSNECAAAVNQRNFNDLQQQGIIESVTIIDTDLRGKKRDAIDWASSFKIKVD
jgi:hypothetical protein